MLNATFAPSELTERALHRRAVEAVNWGIPAVNTHRMYLAMKSAGGDWNQIAIMPKLQNWKNQTLTPNADLIYLLPFIDTRDAGPIVLEIPPADDGSITGSIMDCWQGALETVGPAGVDKGKGGKYLILPPDYKQSVPDGYIALQSSYLRTTPCCAPFLRAVAPRTLPRPSPMPDESSCTRSHRRGSLLTQRLRMFRTSSSRPRSPMTCASSNRSIASFRTSRGSSVTRS